jgi:ubiquinone/menaquinone biosynthesis C-methylase UbiE
LGAAPPRVWPANLAGIRETDHIVDLGCGPGAAVREVGRRGGQATGVDPSPLMLRLARWITALRRARNVARVQAAAKALPLPNASASVVWRSARPTTGTT